MKNEVFDAYSTIAAVLIEQKPTDVHIIYHTYTCRIFFLCRVKEKNKNILISRMPSHMMMHNQN